MTQLGDRLVRDGTTSADAGRLIEGAGFAWRITVLDGAPQRATKDLRADRFSLAVDHGVVVGYTIG